MIGIKFCLAHAHYLALQLPPADARALVEQFVKAKERGERSVFNLMIADGTRWAVSSDDVVAVHTFALEQAKPAAPAFGTAPPAQPWQNSGVRI